jgi:hypothetical protein
VIATCIVEKPIAKSRLCLSLLPLLARQNRRRTWCEVSTPFPFYSSLLFMLTCVFFAYNNIHRVLGRASSTDEQRLVVMQSLDSVRSETKAVLT